MILIGLLLLALIAYIMFFKNFSTQPRMVEQNNSQSGTNQVNSSLPVQNQATKATVPTPTSNTKTELTQNDLKVMAAAFAERFGSFSNQDDFGNLTDLKVFMSTKMQNWVDQYIKDEIAKKSSTSTYYGITTKAVSETVQSFDKNAGTAQITVSTQRKESTGTPNNSDTFSQNISIAFVKENGIWKIDSANWESK